jgi:hypothetical protein
MSAPLPAAAPAAATSSRAESVQEGIADTYAVVEVGGHQLIVEEGRWYTVNRLEVGLAARRACCYYLNSAISKPN